MTPITYTPSSTEAGLYLRLTLVSLYSLSHRILTNHLQPCCVTFRIAWTFLIRVRLNGSFLEGLEMYMRL